ncbi:MAG TPA: PDZ domain-containing protein [Vicinamibacterales bacterium]|nr:PDZ domain-containing protein [Vicinamibacterales bacterium]
MRLLKIVGTLVLAVAAAVVVTVYGPFGIHASAQDRGADRGDRHGRELSVLSGRGAEIGVSVRDLEPAEAERQKAGGGAVVDEVDPDGAAARAGLKRADVIVDFDGEHVRSARQFTRLVRETAPGRTVKATVVRDGKRLDLQVTPADARTAYFSLDADRLGDRVRERLGDMGDFLERMPPMTFDFDWSGLPSRGRLGVTVDELTDQLGAYFGAKEGVLVAAVTDDSPAARAGIKAGDVITAVNGDPVRSRAELARAIANVREDDATIDLVRDRKAQSVKVKIEPRRRMSRGSRPA